MKDLTAFQRDVLYVMSGMSNPNGQDIKKVIEEYYAKDINNGQLYPSLEKLENIELIKKQKEGKQTNSYTLTEEAKRMMKSRRLWEQQEVDGVIEEL